jgi:hypothetical protein
MRKAKVLTGGTLTLLAVLPITSAAWGAKGEVLVLSPVEPEPGVVSHVFAEPGSDLLQFITVQLGGGMAKTFTCGEQVREELIDDGGSSVSMNAYAQTFSGKRKGCELGLMKTPGIELSGKRTMKLKGAFEAELRGCAYKLSHISTAPLAEDMEAEMSAEATLVPKASSASGCEATSTAGILLSPATAEGLIEEAFVEVHVKQPKK